MSNDFFSVVAQEYALFRPVYPNQLFEFLITKLSSNKSLLDVATGNGQVSFALKDHFDVVYGIDISKNQLENASPLYNGCYTINDVHQMPFEPDQFDLITVAQAFHWFDFEKSFQEMLRVLNKGGIIAIWGYGLMTTSNTIINSILKEFYWHKIHQYWPKERLFIETAYQSIPLFQTMNNIPNYFIEVEWTLELFIGYIKTWSSCTNYLKMDSSGKLLDDFFCLIKSNWKEEKCRFSFPIFGYYYIK